MSEKEQRIVCAALCNERRQIICGVRHYDQIMAEQISISSRAGLSWYAAEQGFVDQRGNFFNRQDAWKIAVAAGQIKYPTTQDNDKLFSEHLY